MFKLTVLGKYGPYPKAGGACSSYLVETEKTKILIDMGNGSLANLQKFVSFEKIDLIILTHLHSDHMSDILTLRYAIQVNGIDPITLYLPNTPKPERDLLCMMNTYRDHAINENLKFVHNDLTISFKKMKHPVEAYAVKICNDDKTFVFSSDTVFNNDIIAFSQNCDLLLFDCAILEADRTVNFPHTSAYQAAYVASKAKVKRLLLTHINPNAHENKLLKEAKDVFDMSEIVKGLASYEI
jgi:ribonuclease BN (tRNA processing enzyme)